MSHPRSCDTFVCLPPLTKDNVIVFGKNSDRPSEEVQEIVYFPRATHAEGAKVSCTYIQVDQVPETEAVILSKPSWMWGAEMGSNSAGVCIGNEAVWTNIDTNMEKKLLGMDLLRLALERGKTAEHALKVIVELLEKHGQGGPCSDIMTDFTYHNSFLIVDHKEAWVLETAGQVWAAERITSGFRNISNSLSIGCKIDLMSEGLLDQAKALGLWSSDSGSDFNFAKVFGMGGPCGRYHEGKRLLHKHSKDKQFDLQVMMNILRDEGSGINMGGYDDGGFSTTSSQISVLPNREQNPKSFPCHWFTGTPDPECSVFKPFIFTQSVQLPLTLTSSVIHPRDKKKVDRRHPLYKIHEKSYFNKVSKNPALQKALRQFELTLISKIQAAISESNSSASSSTVDAHDLVETNSDIDQGNNTNPIETVAIVDPPETLKNIFNEATEAEIKLYV